MCQENKAQKRDSVQFFPLESLISPGTCPWAEVFVAGGGNAPFTPEVVLALRFFVFILPKVRPRIFRLWRRVRPPVIV